MDGVAVPDQSGNLSESEKKKAQDWLRERMPAALTCSVCNTQNWILADHVVAPPIFGRGLVLGGTAYPHVMLICRQCGHTVFFNAVMMGLVEKRREKAEEPEAKKAEAE